MSGLSLPTTRTQRDGRRRRNASWCSLRSRQPWE